MVSINKIEIYCQVKPNTSYEEQFLFLFFFLFTCNPRLGELRDYGSLAQGQLPQARERRKVPYVFLVTITPGYQGKSHSLPRLVKGRSVILFHSGLLQLLPSRTLAKVRLRGYYHLPKVNPQTNGGKGASYNPHSRLSQNLATVLKCLYLDKLANTGTDTVQVRV